MCTLVCRWRPDEPFPVQALAVRDELAGRPFDEPGAWWPQQPGVVGGRDRQAGGSWCVSDVATGTTAVVLNRPERRTAAPGAPSRGVLPLLAVRAGRDWTDELDPTGMAGFNLVLASPAEFAWWSFDGEQLRSQSLQPGDRVFTPRGLVERPAAGLVGVEDEPWPAWRATVRATAPSDDPAGSLLVRRRFGDDWYESVFAQLIAARPGELRVDHVRDVARDPGGAWTSRRWPER